MLPHTSSSSFHAISWGNQSINPSIYQTSSNSLKLYSNFQLYRFLSLSLSLSVFLIPYNITQLTYSTLEWYDLAFFPTGQTPNREHGERVLGCFHFLSIFSVFLPIFLSENCLSIFVFSVFCLHAHSIYFRDRDKTGKTLNTKMPSAPTHTAEEAHLLG